MTHYLLELGKGACLLVDLDGSSMAKGVEGLVLLQQLWLLFELSPKTFEEVFAIGVFGAREDVRVRKGI